MPKNETTDLGLSDRDKTPNESGSGMRFHHTDPQRRVPCVLGDLLCPRSADDIAPITPTAMASVQDALTLLANLVADRDFNLFFGYSSSTSLALSLAKARDILLTAKGLAGILRVVPQEAPKRIDLTAAEVKALEQAREHVRVHMPHQHSWETRDNALAAIDKTLDAARSTL